MVIENQCSELKTALQFADEAEETAETSSAITNPAAQQTYHTQKTSKAAAVEEAPRNMSDGTPSLSQVPELTRCDEFSDSTNDGKNGSPKLKEDKTMKPDGLLGSNLRPTSMLELDRNMKRNQPGRERKISRARNGKFIVV